MTIDPQDLSIAGFSIILVGALVQFAKQAIELRLDPLKQKGAHDLAIQGCSLVLGILSVLLLSLALNPAPITGRALATDVLIGIAVGFAASGQYSLLTALKGLVETPTK